MKINSSTREALNCVRFDETTIPPVEKTLSELAQVAVVARYFRATIAIAMCEAGGELHWIVVEEIRRLVEQPDFTRY